MAAAQTLSQSSLVSDKVRSLQNDHSSQTGRRTQSPVYIPPNEFRMKLLKRILSVDGTLDSKAIHKLQKTSSERTLQANILFQNGDIGTLITFDRLDDSTSEKNETETEDSLPQIQKEETTEKPRDGVKRERPLKLPPIMLPPIHRVAPKPLIVRDFSGPVVIPPEPTEEDWEVLEDCRYLRPAKKHFKLHTEKKSFLL